MTSRVRTLLVLERQFRVMVLHRHRLLFDSRYAPSQTNGEGVTLYVVVEGALQVAGHPPVLGRQAYVLAEMEFERTRPGARTFRSWGAPNMTLEIRLAPGVVRAPIGQRSWRRTSRPIRPTR